MVRLRGRNDADERQQAKTAAEMRRQEQTKEVQTYEERRAQRALPDDVPGIPGHRDRLKELREMLGISRKLAYKLIGYGYIHAVKIGTTLKIPKISVINYVMEKEVKKVG